MTQQQLFALGFFAVLALLLYQIVVIFHPFLLPLLWAAILAHVAYPLHVRMTRWLGSRPALSAALLTICILALGVVPVVILTAMLIEEAGAAYVGINAWIEAGGLKTLPGYLERLPIAGQRLQPVLGRLIVSQADVQQFLLQNVKGFSTFLVSQVGGLAANAFLLTASFLVMIFTLFFFFRDGRRLYENFYQIVPLDDLHKQKIFARLDRTLTAVVKGMIVTAIVQGALAGMAYAVLDVPFPVFLMALTTLLAPLPFGGTALVWGPVAIYLFIVGPIWKGIAMLVWGFGVVTTVDNILRPILIGKEAQLPLLFLFLSIVGGLAAYGLIGLFLGPILLAILLTALQIYREEYQQPPVP